MSRDGAGPVEEIDRSSPTTSRRTAVAAGLVATLLLVPSVIGAVTCMAGALLVAAGTKRGNRRLVDYGAAGLFAGVILAGVVGLPPLFLLPAAVLAVLAWDTGQQGAVLGRQIRTAARTRRAEVVHAALSAAAGVTTAGVAYLLFRLAAAPITRGTLVALLLAVVLLAISFQRLLTGSLSATLTDRLLGG